MQSILVAVDLKEDTTKLAEFAAAFAGKYNSKVWFIHVAAPDPDFVSFEAGPQYVRENLAGELREEHRALQQLAEQFRQAGMESDGLLVQGPTVKTILEEADKLGAGLIITGGHEHSFMHNLFTESTSQELFKKTHIPLLLVPLQKNAD